MGTGPAYVPKSRSSSVLQDPTGIIDAGLHASALKAHHGLAAGAILYLSNVRLVVHATILQMLLHGVSGRQAPL